MYLCIYIHIIYIYVRVYVYTYVYSFMYICMYTYPHTYVYISTDVLKLTEQNEDGLVGSTCHQHVLVSTHADVYACIHVYIYILYTMWMYIDNYDHICTYSAYGQIMFIHQLKRLEGTSR